MTRALALVVFAILGCGSAPEPGDERLRWLGYGEFKTEVEPIYEARCANPSCHGRSERALSLYAPLGRRSNPKRLHLDEPLSEDEVQHNYFVSCALATEGATPASTLLLRKPLAEYAGTYHGGGAVFDGPLDDRYRTLERWVERGWQ